MNLTNGEKRLAPHTGSNPFRPFIDSFVIVYLDEILIFSSTWEEHILQLRHVLETLRKHRWLANIKKCECAKKSLVNTGHVIGGGFLEIDCQRWRPSSDVKNQYKVFEETIASGYAIGVMLKQWGKSIYHHLEHLTEQH